MSDLLKKSKLIYEIKDDQIRSEIINCFSKYTRFVEPHMDLFDEYTDHSKEHIEFVVKTAEELIPENTLNLLNDKDLFILLLSILYHDIGMHISKDALKRMINVDEEGASEFKFKESNLKQIWKKYYEEIKKYDSEFLEETFEKNVEKSILEDENQCQDNIYIIREFVRKNHHIIAHHIAINGFPLIDKTIKFSDSYFSFYHDLAGLVARSHGMDVRKTYHILKEQFHDDWKTPHGIHIIYHMIVLRIADYIHITSDRVNPYKLRMIQFKSERSKIETEKHTCTYESHRLYDSPKTLFFSSSPLNSRVFFEMDTLISQIQCELDTSWGILGEVYGHSNLELTLRRVDSNIKYEDWLDKQYYVTEKINFQMDHRIISLLVNPLYGNNPSYGIRELIQNATDACRFLKEKLGTEYSPQIKIKFYENKDQYYLSIEDNGSGMDLDIIKNYFLKIGVSFKKSSQWKKDSQESTVRSGRFGIGILASYLLGDEIEVTTKRHSILNIEKEDSYTKSKIDSQTYRFKTRIHSKCINIEKVNDFKLNFDNDSGTKIEIKLNELTIDALKKEKLIIDKWYLNDDVKITYEDLNNKVQELDEQKKIVLSEREEQLWNKIIKTDDISDYAEIWWSKEYKVDKLNWHIEFKENLGDVKVELSPNLICNGIIIPEGYNKGISDSIIKEWPTVYIKDTSDALDLDLSRYKLNSPLPFLDRLREETYQYFIYLLLNIEVDKNSKNISTFNPGGIYKQQTIIFYNEGYTLLHPFFMQKIDKKIVRIYSSASICIDDVHRNMSDERGYIFVNTSYYANHFKSEIVNRNCFEDVGLGSTNCIIVNKKIFNDHMNENASNSIKFNQETRNQLGTKANEISELKTFLKFNESIGDCNMYNKKVIDGLSLDDEMVKLVIENIPNNSSKGEKSIFDKYFSGRYIIPYDMDERRKIFKEEIDNLERRFNLE